MNILPFHIQDLPFVRHLQPEGWKDITVSMIEYCQQSFCKPIKVVDQDSIIAIGALILHGSTAWLGHIIVGESYRGQGIGGKVVRYLVDIGTNLGASSINLVATSLGEPVYKKVGFRKVGTYHVFKRHNDFLPKPLSNRLQIATAAHFDEILKLDGDITGEDRRGLIGNHLSKAIIVTQEGSVEGYYFPQLGQGPIYAKTKQAGLELMGLKYSTIDSGGLPSENTAGIQFLIENGFEQENNAPLRMTLGDETYWNPTSIFSRIGGNYG